MEAELRLYWGAMSRAWHLFRTEGILADGIDECRDEVEAIAMHTDWPLLRDICQRTIRRDDEWRMQEVRKVRPVRQIA